MDIVLKINIGGKKGYTKKEAEGWTIVDVLKGSDYVVDIGTQKLPFEDNSIDAIYTSHTLEHIFPHHIDFVFSEMFRVLKEKRRVRIVVPDIDVAINAYNKKNIDFLRSSKNPRKLKVLPDLPIHYLSGWFFTYREKAGKIIQSGHKMCYNEESLRYFLEKHHFKNIEFMHYQKTSKIFKQCDKKRYKYCSLYVEAQKL